MHERPVFQRSGVRAAFFGVHADHAACCGKKGVVTAASDILACVVLGASLADEYVPSANALTSKPLNAKPLALRIPAQTCGTACFCMRHALLPENKYCDADWSISDNFPPVNGAGSATASGRKEVVNDGRGSALLSFF